MAILSNHTLVRLTTALSDHYRIERELGAGGMATVYLARDLKHDRDVAIKVLHPDLAAALGGDRFLSEIKTTARLQHPHILPLLDSGESDGLLFYVMPYVRGETLRDRLQRETQLPVADALRIATEIADALAAAHDAGIIHRDIKPENILLQGEHALVADFGIALAVQQAGGERMTQTGLSLGTPQYMAPEQAMGDKTVDQRADIYALGAVTYEMLTGEPPHTGANAQAIVAKLLTEHVRPVAVMRPSVPAHVDAALQVSLQKLPADRFGTVREFVDALRGGANTRFTATATTAVVPIASRGSRKWLQFVPHLVLVAAIVTLMLRGRGDAPTQRQQVVLWHTSMPNALSPGATIIGTQAALAPDGSSIVYTDSSNGWMLWRKERGALVPAPLVGTEGGISPTFSPDGKWLAFTTFDGRLKKMPVSGGSPVTLAEDVRADYKSLAWLDDGNIIYMSAKAGLTRLSASGSGSAKLLKDPSGGIGSIITVSPLPGSRGVLLAVCQGNCAFSTSVWVYDFAADTGRLIVPNVAGAWYSPTGHLLYTSREGGLFAQEFDAKTLQLHGDPTPVLDNVAPGQLSVTPNGTLLYSMLPGAAGTSELMWVDRSGRATSFDTAWTGRFEYPAISPDGQRIAVSLRERATELWIRRADGTRRKVIAPLTGSWRPAWHADGKMLTFIGFNDQEKNPNDVTVWQVDQDASAAAQKIFSHRYGVYEAEISPDKQWMLFRADEGAEAGNIYARHTSGDTSLIPLVVGSTNDLQPTLSPDGKRMAYTSNEGGVQQVFVASFPDMKVKRVVSRGPGMEPRWARSGKELFFVSGSRLMSVAIGEGADIPVAEPMPLFPVIGYRRARNRPQYDVAPGDQRFLMIKDPPLPPVPPVVYVENWFPELRAKLKK